MRKRLALGLSVVIAGCLMRPACFAQVPVSVTVAPAATPAAIPPNFEGVSYETALMLPGDGGRHYFDPKNARLARMFQTLGIRSLRVGGATVDNPRFAVPAQADIDSLFQFAQAAHAKVIYSFRLKDGDIPTTLTQAKYITDHYADSLDCFAIGNEPNEYFANYAQYAPVWSGYFDALSKQNPDVKFCGPSAWREDWARDFAQDPAHKGGVNGHLAFVSQHEYAFGPATPTTDPAKARDKMLAKNDYDRAYSGFVPAVLQQGLQYRLEETSNFARGGQADASDAYAAALWGLDDLYWWAAHGAQGINFHTGDYSVGQGRAFRYSVFVASPTGYAARPLAYALLAFKLGSQGQWMDAKTQTPENAPGFNVKAYAVLAPDKALYVTILNKDHGASGRDAAVTVGLPASLSYRHGSVIFLTAPQADVAAKTGITLGGAPIDEDGNWRGRWTPLPTPGNAGGFLVKVPAASAAVLKLTAR